MTLGGHRRLLSRIPHKENIGWVIHRNIGVSGNVRYQDAVPMASVPTSRKILLSPQYDRILIRPFSIQAP